MVSNTRDRNIDSSRREDSRKGQVDRCEVINVRPHVAPYPADKDFNTVDVQLIDRPRIAGEPLTIKYVKLNSLQREHGLGLRRAHELHVVLRQLGEQHAGFGFLGTGHHDPWVLTYLRGRGPEGLP